jgi:hypothetical protein
LQALGGGGDRRSLCRWPHGLCHERCVLGGARSACDVLQRLRQQRGTRGSGSSYPPPAKCRPCPPPPTPPSRCG